MSLIKDKNLTGKPSPENGFTLIELMIVVAITALIAGFTVAEINSTGYKLKGAARTLRAKMQQAKLLAVKENCNVYVDFNLDNDGESDSTINTYYCIWKDVLSPNKEFSMKDIAGNSVTSKYKSAEFVSETPLPSGISAGTVSNSNGGPDSGPPATNPSIPPAGVSYLGDRIAFSPQGTSSKGWTYLHAPNKDSSGTYGVGSNAVGRVTTWYWITNGDKWR